MLIGPPGGKTPTTRISYKRRRFPPTVIQHAVWLYFRFTLSFRNVEEMLAHRGIDVSYETIRVWTVKFDPTIAANCVAANFLRLLAGILISLSRQSQANACGSGVLSTTKER